MLDSRVAKRHAEIALSHSQTQIRSSTSTKESPPRWIINFLDSEKTKTVIPKSLLTNHDRSLYLIYRHLWSAGFWLTSGLKYGSDWLAYRGTPELYHSEVLTPISMTLFDLLILSPYNFKPNNLKVQNKK